MSSVTDSYIERILVVDDESEARVGFGYSVEDLGLTPVDEAGPINDLGRFVAELESKADAVLCDYRLKTQGAYSRFNGDAIVAECYRRGIPGVMCTMYTDVFVEMSRMDRRYIPSVIKTNSPDPGDVIRSLLFCREEIRGVFHPARKPWRALVRIEDVVEDADYCYAVVPTWNPHQAIRLALGDIPASIRPNVTAGFRLFAQINTGADSSDDVYFSEWELE